MASKSELKKRIKKLEKWNDELDIKYRALRAVYLEEMSDETRQIIAMGDGMKQVLVDGKWLVVRATKRPVSYESFIEGIDEPVITLADKIKAAKQGDIICHQMSREDVEIKKLNEPKVTITDGTSTNMVLHDLEVN